MSNLGSRIRRVETGIDVTRLSREQIQLLDVSRLSIEQIHALDLTQLTEAQCLQLDIDKLSSAQLEVVCDEYDRQHPEMRAVFRSMSDEELDAVKRGRLSPWHPGYTGEFNA